MPIYEYQCAGCEAVFEVLQGVSDPPPAKHSCGSTDVRRVLSNTSFRLKGSGWYMTDYPRSGEEGKAKGKTDASPAPAEASKASDATPSTPAAKKDPPAPAK